MSKKNRPDQQGYVYSTDPNFSYEHESNEEETLPPAKQQLYVRLDTKQRAGKAVTVVERFVGKTDDLEELGKKTEIPLWHRRFRQGRNCAGAGRSTRKDQSFFAETRV